MTESLKKKTSKAIFWSFIDKGGQQLIQLIIGVVLARVLLTSDIGTFALLAIFSAVANILQESGFTSALVRSKNPSEADFTSVFYFNIAVGLLCYFILYFCAPLISNFYDNPILTPLSRVVFLAFVCNSFGIIQNATLLRKMDFKTNTRITLIASSISGIVAVIMAMQGMGIWSLATQFVVQSFLRCVLLWWFVKWRPKAEFSYTSIKSMSGYSSKLLATSLLNQICGNLYANIIGKFFSPHQTGVFSQANKFSTLPQTVVADGIRTAAFPALSKIEGDLEYTKKAFRKVVRITAFVSFPVALLTIVIAKPIILILLTNKWADSIPILQILAIGGAFYPLYTLVYTLLQTIGKSGLILKIETARNLFAIALIFITIHFGVIGLVAGMSLVSIVAFFMGMTIAGKSIKYTFTEIIKDISPYIFTALISTVSLLFLEYWGISNIYALLLAPCLLVPILYLGILKLAGSVILDDSIEFFKQLMK